MIANFPALNLTVDTGQFAEDKGDFELSESICTGGQLKFGKCNASQVKFTVADVTDEITGKEFSLTQQVINGSQTYDFPLGHFTVETAPKQDDLRFKDVTAYDRMKRIDVDVADWYRSLPLPMTLSAFRASFLAYVGLEQDTSRLPLPNDSMIVTRTIEPQSLPGRTVIEACEEINGAFGHISRESGKFKHVILMPTYGLCPSNDLYPSDDLYPISETDASYVQGDLINETISRGVERVRFEEYTVREIDKLIIRSDEDDIGAIVGTGTNAYIIQGNFLTYGKSAAELQVIANNAFGNMAKRPYRPYESTNIGLPYLEPGDMIKFDQEDPVVGYIFNRTLTGIQVLNDEYKASGSRELKQNTSVNEKIAILDRKATRIKMDVEGVRIDLEDLSENVDTSFSVVHGQITAEVTRATAAEGTLSSSITLLAGEMELKVSRDGVIAAINLSPETARITANNIALEGIITANGRFKINLDGSMEATNGKFSGELVAATGTFTGTLNGNNIIAPNISGGQVSGARIVSQSGSDATIIENGRVSTTYISMASGSLSSSYAAGGVGYTDSSNGNSNVVSSGGIQISKNGVVNARILPDGNGRIKYLDCDTLNGYTPVTIGNIGSAYAKGVTNGLRSAYISTADNFIPNASDMYVGSSSNYWAGAYLGSGPVVTSDRNKKHSIDFLSEKYLKFAGLIMPRVFKYNDGTSDRLHVGFIAQEVEEAMIECGISDKEFAGLIKSPKYSKMLKDNDGTDLEEYDTESDIIGYDYGLRDNEFIPLLFGLYHEIISILLK
ncbi:tail fiber domain-containing protein [Anaerotaenia torta]|uniref:tail fiber domain-containing protein n=1 Tax=Anaerotaenia torta TaxID=433293 RepID=UPI003D2234A4